MRVIIHDLEKIDVCFNSDDIVIDVNKAINRCIGCFSCWIKTPTNCVHGDCPIVDYLKNADEFIIISKSRYGCYSSNVKKILERTIGYVLPYFEMRKGFIHHKDRYSKRIKLIVYFYGIISKKDKECLENLVRANSINFNVEYNINYLKELKNVYIN